MQKYLVYLLLCTCWGACTMETSNDFTTDVLVVGEGTGAVAAAIQSARSGAKTTLVTPSKWLGGMLTAAGVSATDGNHRLPAGLWGEFRDSLQRHYGGIDSLFTGWVSNTMFEPKVGEYYWQQMAKKERLLTIVYEANFIDLSLQNGVWKGQFDTAEGTQFFRGKVVVDGTDLGDVAAAAGATFDVGMDSREQTNEAMAPPARNEIIQDMTYAAILKDYGPKADKTIPRPDNYDASQFFCACAAKCKDDTAKPHPCQTMLDYGKLPNGKYMINWPIKGNDYYVNMIDMGPSERQKAMTAAKNKTLQFIYYIQNDLGYKNLGLAEDEFPTEDDLPLMPYHREGRRIHGLVQLNVNHILQPYDYTLYRTSIAVGDYPIDHHHYERPDAPAIDFPPVPSFSVPLGCLIPKGVQNFVVADKAISVTNIVNGSSRLQPVIVQIGQVAGMVAATAALSEKSPDELSVRVVQEKLLATKGYLLPFIDVEEHPHFASIQRIGATGLLKGTGIPYKWANQTWFYPDSTILVADFLENLADFGAPIKRRAVPPNAELSVEEASVIIGEWLVYGKKEEEGSAFSFIEKVKTDWPSDFKGFEENRSVTRSELAFLLDKYINPFEQRVDMEGNFVQAD
ncbi:MAG: FAD-dependent oxidoreductase [Bacteroidota bacterium]